MNRTWIALPLLLLLLLASAGLAAAQDLPLPEGKPAPTPEQLKQAYDQASYAIGHQVGGSLKNDGLEVNLELLVQGLKEALGGTESKYSQEQLRAAFDIVKADLQVKAEKRRIALAEKNLRDGAAFLTANKVKPGVKSTASGLQYQVIKAGNGPSPQATDTVRTHYHGTLIDGTVFDSSVERKQPATFPVNGVIKGWSEALQLMKVGDKWRLFVPADLAYDQRGAGEDIGPNAVLIFDVELLGIEP